MQVLESQSHLCHVEGRDFFCKHPFLRQMGEQFSALRVFKDEVKLLVVLERVE